MAVRFKTIHPALKHAAYSATTLLPGEDRAAFEKLHCGLVAEFNPLGLHEEHIVANLAHAIWREQNLMTFRIAELAQTRRSQIANEKIPRPAFSLWTGIDPGEVQEVQEASRAADQQARQELGDIHQLIDIGEPATIVGLMKELDVKERLGGIINRCHKQLLMVRGVKSLSSAAASEAAPQIPGPRKAG